MAFTRSVIAFSALVHASFASVFFEKSTLYDEQDLSGDLVLIDLCKHGCRLYVSVPDASIEFAKVIMVQDNIHDDISLYDISKMENAAHKDQKGFLAFTSRNLHIQNINFEVKTAPIAVWLLLHNANGIDEAAVYDAASANVAESSLSLVTVMSAEPYMIRTKTNGKMELLATLSGFDSVADPACANVVTQSNEDALSDIYASVRSPLFSISFNVVDYKDTMTSLSASLGIDELDFSANSFAASPGFMSCGAGQMTRSSLFVSSSFTYFKSGWQYDVDVDASYKKIDDQHPLTLKDNTNEKEYKWPETVPDILTIKNTGSLDISWVRDEDQFFLIRLVPSNAKQVDAPPIDSKTTATITATTTTTLSSLKTVHPRDISTTVGPTKTFTITPTTSGGAEYAAAFFVGMIATVFML